MLTFFCLRLADPPVITKAPVTTKVKAGGIAAFLCAATGDPTPTIAWRKNGNVISFATSRYILSYMLVYLKFEFSRLFCRYQVHNFPGGSLLRIEPVRRKREDADFECVAENGVGDPVSAKATLKVFDGELVTAKGFLGEPVL